MRVCVVGGGGREHALAVALGRTADVVVTPGNPGIPGSTPAPPEEIDADLFVIGPEAPLVDGLADRLRARGALVLGPGADGARLEASKAWMKEMCLRAGVPTARYATFTDEGPALAYLDGMGAGPYVVKTDGLAAGKGAFVTASRREAADDIRAKLSGRSFGPAGRRVVIEEGLVGEEVTVLAVSDGRTFSVLPVSQDHKRVGDGDTGLNTGGMGAYCPVPQMEAAAVDRAVERCVEPMLGLLRSDGVDYRGILYAGLMLTDDGPRVIEYNVRFGDPEAEAVVPLLDGDVTAWLASAAAGSLSGDASVSGDAVVTVVMCSEGYGTESGPRVGDRIVGIGDASALEGVSVFHSATSTATATGPDGHLYTAGGRVLAVTARRPTLAAARDLAYRAVARISWPGQHHRTDIAHRGLDHLAPSTQGALR